jgi:hypothetical protein
MILSRYSPSSIFPRRVSIAIDSTPRGLVADRNMRSERQMSASLLSSLFQRRGQMRRMNPFSFDGEQAWHAIHGEHSVKRWGSDE